MKEKKWFIANNTIQKNKDITIILPVIKFWYSKCYFLETGCYTPAFGMAFSFLKSSKWSTIIQNRTKIIIPILLKTNVFLHDRMNAQEDHFQHIEIPFVCPNFQVFQIVRG